MTLPDNTAVNASGDDACPLQHGDEGDAPRVQTRTLRTLSISQILSGVAVAGSLPAGSLLVASISGSEALAGLAQTSSLLGSAVMALPLAALALKRGRRVSLVTGYSLAGVGALVVVLGSASRTLPLIFVGIFLVGFATAAANQARFAATDLAPEHRVGRAFAWVAWAATIGAILGPYLIAPAGSVALGWGLPQLSGAYVMCAAALLMGCLVLTTFLRPDPYLTSVRRGGSVRGGPPSIADGYRELRRQPRAMLGIGVIVAGHVVMVMVMVMTPVYMKHVDVSLSVIGLVISAHVAGMYALSPMVGWAVDRLGPFAMVGVGIAVLITACITCSVTPANHDLTLGAGLFLLGVGWSCTLIAGSAMLTEAIDPRHRPAVQGLSDLSMNAAGAVGGIMAGLIVAALSYSALALLALVPLALLCAALATPACRRRSNARSI
ncbi:MAG: MFS transporter [Candidatus Nanopelagicales bacterium]|nr:MFS transporter [Candidatus Nanopelagicales bacterium]